MEFVTNKVNFYYDPRRQGYDAAAWHTLTGAPAIVGTNLVFNNASAVGKADIGRGEITMSLIVPTAPTAGDTRSWGLAQTNLGAFAMFRITDTYFTAEVYDGYGNYKVEQIPWLAAWTNTETEYKIKYTPDGWHFYVGGVEKSFINQLFTTAIAATTQVAADTLTKAAHGLAEGQMISLSYVTTTTGIDDKTFYYVTNPTLNTFQLSLSRGGAVVDLATNDGSCLYQTLPDVQSRKAPMGLYVLNGEADAMELVYIQVLDAEVYSSGISATVSVSADTEFPAATVLADNDANPTTTRVGANLLGWDGSNWDRIKAGIVSATSSLSGFVNSLTYAIFHTTPATRTNNQGGPLEADSTGNLKVVNMASLIKVPYDYIEDSWNAGTFTETFTYKTGGSGGTTVATLTVIYTDATKEQLVSVTLS